MLDFKMTVEGKGREMKVSKRKASRTAISKGPMVSNESCLCEEPTVWPVRNSPSCQVTNTVIPDPNMKESVLYLSPGASSKESHAPPCQELLSTEAEWLFHCHTLSLTAICDCPLQRCISGNIVCCCCCSNRTMEPPATAGLWEKSWKSQVSWILQPRALSMIQPQMALELTAGEPSAHMEGGRQVWLEAGGTELENLFKGAGYRPCLAFSCNL